MINEKSAKLFALFLTSIFHTSCGQNQTNASKDNIKSETKDLVTPPGSDERNFYTKYEYADSIGKRLIIQNSFPKSTINYTDPDGKKYTYAIFWTRIINETFDTLKVTIDFPLDSFEFSPPSGRYMKLLLPSDTMTIDKEPLLDYGLNLKSFLDNHRYKSSSLKRTINPGDSSAFYIVTLSNRVVAGSGSGILRPGLSLREQDLFYTISIYTPTPPTLSLINDKEIHCGKINLKNLRLQK